MRYLVGLLLVVLVGCTQPVTPSPSSSAIGPPTSPSMPSSPSASPTCSPMGGTPRACSPEEFQKTEEQNRLTEEAIALYRRWTKESTRLYRAGGTDKPTKEMLEITAGDFRGSVLGIFQDIKAARVRALKGEVKIVTIGPDGEPSKNLDEVSIKACLDSRSLSFFRNGKHIRDGGMFFERVITRRIDGKLVLWSARSGSVDTCAGG
ncbi:hypothetical protein [Micropruina sp.]|uniref:hypothetical protein n=1 Tax=Micropruina sp. TaxID=2737536 RepID=UPI0039E4ABDD